MVNEIMLIQFILTIIFLVILLYVVLVNSLSLIVKVLMYTLCLCGCTFVWFPSITIYIANFLGVGRGADLLLYTWISVSCLLVFIGFLNVTRVNRDITILARKIALQNYLKPEPSENQSRENNQ